MESYSGRILVEDATGTRLHVHEYVSRRPIFRARRYMLDTGEPVRRADRRTFVIVPTGERLTVVDDEQ